MRYLALLITGLSACALPTEDFIYEAAVWDCTWALECLEDDTLTFYGWTDQSACVESRGSAWSAVSESCPDYDKKAAKECLAQMETRVCGDAEIPLPEICAQVYLSCDTPTP